YADQQNASASRHSALIVVSTQTGRRQACGTNAALCRASYPIRRHAVAIRAATLAQPPYSDSTCSGPSDVTLKMDIRRTRPEGRLESTLKVNCTITAPSRLGDEG